MSCGNLQLWSCSTNTDTGCTNNDVTCSEHSRRMYCTCAVNCMLSRSVPHLADTGNCIQHMCIHTQCMMLYNITGKYSALTVPWPNWKYCHDISEEGLKKTTKYDSDVLGAWVYQPEASPCFAAHWRLSCVIWYWYCAPPTLPDKLALLCRPWPCAYFGSPLMTFEPSEGFSWNKLWTQRHGRQPLSSPTKGLEQLIVLGVQSVGCPECWVSRVPSNQMRNRPPAVQRSRWVFKTSKPDYFSAHFA